LVCYRLDPRAETPTRERGAIATRKGAQSRMTGAQWELKPSSILYLCYLGICEPLVQTQVVPYLAGLSRSGHRIVLMTFEPAPLSQATRRSYLDSLHAARIEWQSLRYHKRPALPATCADVLTGIIQGARLVRKYQINVLHARGDIPAMIAIVLKHFLGVQMVFDIRGLIADEYADAGLWRRNGPLFWMTKRLEDVFLAHADAIIVLTRRVKAWFSESGKLRCGVPLEVIPCCVDLRRFDLDPHRVEILRKDLALDGRPVMVYAGKVGGWYMLEEMIDFFHVAAICLPDLCFLLLTQSEPARIEELFASKGIHRSAYRCLAVSPRDLPQYLGLADFAIAFRAPRFSQIAASPTKVPEYLAAGLPVVYNAGIGDLDELASQRVGTCVESFGEAGYSRAVGQLRLLLAERAATAARCRNTAQELFALATVGIPGYLCLYAALADRRAGGMPRGPRTRVGMSMPREKTSSSQVG
jgi:glycosyltransferase involved in cell wall biosynthesis